MNNSWIILQSTMSTLRLKKKPTRSFQQSCKDCFSWLEYNEKLNLMSCKYCSNDPRGKAAGSELATGSSKFKKETLKKHNDSANHRHIMDSFLVKDKPKQIVAGFQKQLEQTDQKVLNDLKIKFNTAYAIAKEELPFTKFPTLLQLQRKHGLLTSNIYENDMKCAEIIHCISSSLKDSLVDVLRSSMYFSVMIDAATDTSIKENEAVVVRFVNNEGLPDTRVLGVMELEHAHAEGTLDAIKKSFSAAHGMQYENHLVGFCSDGASVNFGKKSGVAKKLHDECPWLIPIWCLPHRLELAVMEMLKKSGMGSKVIEVLHLVYKTYHFSPKSKRELQTLANELGVKVKSPTRVKGTRWSPHTKRALHILLKPQKVKDHQSEGQYSIVYQHMEHLAESSTNADIKGRAKFLTKSMSSFIFLAFCHVLLDILSIISTLSFTLQANKTILTTAVSAIKSCILSLETLKTTPLSDGALSDFIDLMKSQSGQDISVKFQGVILKDTLPELDLTLENMPLAFRNACNEALSIVINGMNNRYSSLVASVKDDPSSIVQSMKVFHHDSWPERLVDLGEYGNEQVSSLTQWFEEILQRNGCHTKEILPEWRGLKVLVSTEFHNKTFTGLWKLLITKDPYKEAYENILQLVKIMLVLPVSSAQCERTFSAMNRIKNDVRNSLRVQTVEDLIRISAEGPDLMDFDPIQAVKKWLSVPRKVQISYQGWPEHDCDPDIDDTDTTSANHE